MKMTRKKMYRTMIAAIATTALTAGMSSAALAGDGSPDKQDWKGEMNDAWIDGKIEASYSLSQYLNPFDIDTDVSEGTVVLTGTVDSQIDKDLAEEIASGIEGVTEVRNELTVAEQPADRNAVEKVANEFGTHFNDATITARVKWALLSNDSTEGLKINVDTVNGTVMLNGEVSSEQERELAERVAVNAEGVADVKNRLKVSAQS